MNPFLRGKYMKSRKGALSALCLVGLLVAVCGDDNNGSSGGTAAPSGSDRLCDDKDGNENAGLLTFRNLA